MSEDIAEELSEFYKSVGSPTRRGGGEGPSRLSQRTFDLAAHRPGEDAAAAGERRLPPAEVRLHRAQYLLGLFLKHPLRITSVAETESPVRFARPPPNSYRSSRRSSGRAGTQSPEPLTDVALTSTVRYRPIHPSPHSLRGSRRSEAVASPPSASPDIEVIASPAEAQRGERSSVPRRTGRASARTRSRGMWSSVRLGVSGRSSGSVSPSTVAARQKSMPRLPEVGAAEDFLENRIAARDFAGLSSVTTFRRTTAQILEGMLVL